MSGSSAFLSFDVFADRILTDVASSPCVVGARPKRREFGTQGRKLLPKGTRRITLQTVNDLCHAERGIGFDEQMQMIRHDFECMNGDAKLLGLLPDQIVEPVRYWGHKHLAPELWAPYYVVFKGEDGSRVFSISICHKAKYTSDKQISQ